MAHRSRPSWPIHSTPPLSPPGPFPLPESALALQEPPQPEQLPGLPPELLVPEAPLLEPPVLEPLAPEQEVPRAEELEEPSVWTEGPLRPLLQPPLLPPP